MTFKKLLMISLFAAIPAVTGCGGDDCESVCEDANDCPGATKQDCAKSCDAAEKAAKDAGCEDQFNDMWDCAGGEDVCKADSNACSKEASALFSCLCKSSGAGTDCTIN